MIILPRQARDRHRGSTQKSAVLCRMGRGEFAGAENGNINGNGNGNGDGNVWKHVFLRFIQFSYICVPSLSGCSN